MTQSLYDYCSSCGMTALLEQWDTEKNAPLTPQTVRCGSRQKVWWRCDRGHRWQALVKSRTGGSGCPVCRNRLLLPGENDLATRFPALAAQWHPTRNGALTPAQVLCTSHHRAWWRCAYGHAWQSRVSSRTQSGTDCPVCAGRAVQTGFNDLAHCFPSLAAQWDRQKNGALSPEQVTAYSNRPVWWRCERGHSYRAAVGARTNAGSGCPYCAGRKVLAGFNDLMTVEPQVASQWPPHAQRRADTADGDGRQPEKGLVAVRRRPCVEGCRLFTHRAEAVRLPRLRRQSARASQRPGCRRIGLNCGKEYEKNPEYCVILQFTTGNIWNIIGDKERTCSNRGETPDLGRTAEGQTCGAAFFRCGPARRRGNMDKKGSSAGTAGLFLCPNRENGKNVVDKAVEK